MGSYAAEVIFKPIETGISVGKFPIFQVSQVLNLGQVDQDLRKGGDVGVLFCVTHLSLFMDAIEAQHKPIVFWSKKEVVYDAISLRICVLPLPLSHFFFFKRAAAFYGFVE